jgi:hypothetical protein
MSTSVQIDFSLLPKTILSQIPYSLRTRKQIHKLEELPIEIQYLLKSYNDNIIPEITYENAYEVKPEMSIYSDLEVITDQTELAIEYFRNYLLIAMHAYPFDAEFGCLLKQQLQTKDSSLRRMTIGNELSLVAATISGDYNVSINIASIEIIPEEHADYTSFYLEVIIKVDGKTVNITV